VEIGIESARFPEKEYINGIFLAVQGGGGVTMQLSLIVAPSDQSGAAKAATRLPPVHQGGGDPAGRPHLPRQVRREQAGALRPAPHAAGARPLGHRQDHVHTGRVSDPDPHGSALI
jgi:hypothetical protein